MSMIESRYRQMAPDRTVTLPMHDRSIRGQPRHFRRGYAGRTRSAHRLGYVRFDHVRFYCVTPMLPQSAQHGRVLVFGPLA